MTFNVCMYGRPWLPCTYVRWIKQNDLPQRGDIYSAPGVYISYFSRSMCCLDCCGGMSVPLVVLYLSVLFDEVVSDKTVLVTIDFDTSILILSDDVCWWLEWNLDKMFERLCAFFSSFNFRKWRVGVLFVCCLAVALVARFVLLVCILMYIGVLFRNVVCHLYSPMRIRLVCIVSEWCVSYMSTCLSIACVLELRFR